ncbi:MAG TPA: alkaline phosphatase family protein [Solirubrobacteraceae bacterium]
MRSFADLPGRLAALAGEWERIAVVLLDGLGRHLLDPHARHPLLRRLVADGELVPVASQFPSTTTAELTTLYTGRPVGEHGLYEWQIYEPALDAVILPLPWVLAGSDAPPALDPAEIVPSPTLFERLAAAGIRCTALQPDRIWPSRYGSAALAGSEVVPFKGVADGAAALARALARPGLAYLYWDGIDYAGHLHGPSSEPFAAAAHKALDAVARAAAALPAGTLLVLAADHGQIDVHPERLDYLDVAWPELTDHLRPLPPAGSARDCFLHVHPGAADAVAAELAERLGERAEVRTVADLVAEGAFGAVGPRLRARLADVCVLPAPGRMAWLKAFGGHEQRFRGHHGGRTREEVDTWVGLLPV